MTNPDETQAQTRSRLHHDFLGRASRVQRLLNTDPEQTSLDPERLRIWQNLYRDPEGTLVLQRLEEITQPGAAPSIATLEEWNAHAAKLLENAPDNPN